MSVLQVLIVEDDPFVALDLESIVQDAADAEVRVAPTVAEARENLDGVDFAFLDIDLIDGRVFDLARMLKARRIPFVFVTGAPRADVPPPLRDAPFIAKPYKVWQIAASLRGATDAAHLA